MTTAPDLPDAERAYLAFKSSFTRGFESLDQAQADFRWTDAPNRRIDPRVHYPLDMTKALANTLIGNGIHTSLSSAQLSQFLHAFGNYRETRTIYTIDRTLFSHLVRSKWPADIPVSAATLPKNGCVLDLPAHLVFGLENIQDAIRIQIVCTYDMNAETQDLDLVLTAFCVHHKADGRPVYGLDSLVAWIDLSAPSLEDAILNHAIFMHGAPERIRAWVEIGEGSLDDLPPEEVRKTQEDRYFSKEWFLYLKSVLSVLLYINGNDDLLEVITQGSTPFNRSAQRRQSRATHASRNKESALRMYRVGVGFASVIQRWEQETASAPGHSGRTLRPHLRAAHAHKFRVGPGRTEVRVKFLPPIPVRGWEAPEELPANRLVR